MHITFKETLEVGKIFEREKIESKMLIAQNLISTFHFLLQVLGNVTTILYTQTSGLASGLGYISVSEKSTKKYPLRYKISAAYTLAALLQILHAVKFNGRKEKVSLVTLMPSILFFLSLFFHLPTMRQHYRKCEEFCPLFNAFLDFERKYNGNVASIF